MIISNTPTLEGYRIVKYLGNVIGAHIYAPGGIFGEGIIRQTKLVAKAYTLATDNMKNEAPYETDAIVGVNTTVTQLIDGTALVTVSGTAVKTDSGTLLLTKLQTLFRFHLSFHSSPFSVQFRIT